MTNQGTEDLNKMLFTSKNDKDYLKIAATNKAENNLTLT